MAAAVDFLDGEVVDEFVQPLDIRSGQGKVVHRPDDQRRDGEVGDGGRGVVRRHLVGRIQRGDLHGRAAIPVQHRHRGVAVLPVREQRFALFRFHRARPVPAHRFQQDPDEPVFAHERVIRRIAELAHVLARLALCPVGEEQALEHERVGRIGDDRAGDTARHLAADGGAPGNRAAPVVADHGELLHPQRIGELEDVADQLVGRVGGDLRRLRAAPIAALVGRNAAIPVGKMRDLVPPGAMAFGEAVQEDQHLAVPGAGIDHIQFNTVGERNAGLLHRAQSSASIFSM